MASFDTDPALELQRSKTMTSEDRIEYYTLIFLRIAGVGLMVAAIVVWAQMLGVHGDDLETQIRFERNEAVLSVLKGVLMPCVAVGLWLGVKWGVMLWGSASLGYSMAVASFPNSDWEDLSIPLAVFALFVFYVIFRLVFYRIKMKKRED